MFRGPVILFLVGSTALASCAGRSLRTSHHTKPKWTQGPSPFKQGTLRCHHAMATGMGGRDEALFLARERAIARMVADVEIQVNSEHIGYQSEKDGQLRVWVGEVTVSKAMGQIWGVQERGTYWEEQRDSRGNAAYDAYVLTCIEAEVYRQMRQDLQDQKEGKSAFAKQEVEKAKALLDRGRLKKAAEHLELAGQALADLPKSGAVVGEAARLKTQRARIRSGIQLSLAQKKPAKLEPGPAITERFAILAHFEGSALEEINFACRETDFPCAVRNQPEPGLFDILIGPVDTRQQDAVKLSLHFTAGSENAVLYQKSMAFPVYPKEDSVAVCGPANTKAAQESVQEALVDSGLTVSTQHECQLQKAKHMVRLLVQIQKARTRCTMRYGDHECTSRIKTRILDTSTGQTKAKVHVKRSFIHPSRKQAIASAQAASARTLGKKLARKTQHIVRRLKRTPLKSP